MLWSLWENKELKKYTDLPATAQQPIAEDRDRLCRHCTIYALHQRLPVGAMIWKKGSEHMCYLVLFSDPPSVRRESHTEPSLLVPFLAGVDGSTDV